EETLDTYLPGPISSRDLDRYARQLGLSKEMQPILSSMHEDYHDGFEQLQETRINDVREKSRSLYAIDPDTNEVSSPSRGDIEQLYSLRRSALDAIKALDNTFFEDVETILPDDSDSSSNMQRIRFARQRDIYSRGRDTGGFRMFGGRGGGVGSRVMSFTIGGGGGSSENVVDLSDLVDELQFESEELKLIDAQLSEYETDMTAQFQDAFKTSMRFNEAMDAMRAESTVVTQGGSRRESRMGGGEMREIMQTDGRRRGEISQAITSLNRSTLDELERLLSANSMMLLRDAYNRRSFPDIFNDSGSAKAAIDATYNLPDLAPHQQSQLDDIATEFRSGYDQLNQQMVDRKLSESLEQTRGERGGRGGRGGGGFDFSAMQERQRAMEKLRFERKDLSDKTRNRIKGFLTEDQKTRLADLLDPKAGESGNVFRIGG
ncbi:MAG: hypothetical protein O7G85_04805, partial [Planctomycetota bacterium]|nr:hypothetical protein [Planctomycetota bacterium]